MRTTPPSDIIGEGITLLELAPDPTGPRTLQEDLYMSEFALKIHERVSCGNGFIAPEAHGNMTRNIENLQTRFELVTEAHPKLHEMYSRHRDLRNKLATAIQSDQSQVPSLQEECSKLATEIVHIEQSVDPGDVQD